PRNFSPLEEEKLLKLGYGITNVVNVSSASADTLTREQYLVGAKKLIAKVKRFQPKVLAILGVGAYRIAFADPTAPIGAKDRTIGPTRLWVLPNPSGLNAHYQARDLAKTFAALRKESL